MTEKGGAATPKEDEIFKFGLGAIPNNVFGDPHVELVDHETGSQVIKSLKNRSVKGHKIAYVNETEDSGIEGLEGTPFILPFIALPKLRIRDVTNTEVETHWVSVGTPNNVHLFLHVEAQKHKSIIHFETRKSRHLKWLKVFANTGLRGPLGVGGEKYGLRHGYFGLSTTNDPMMIVTMPATETRTVGMAILAMRMMAAVAHPEVRQ